MSPRSDRDVVVVSALRTPICKARRGAAKEVPPDDLLLAVLAATLERTGVPPSSIQAQSAWATCR